METEAHAPPTGTVREETGRGRSGPTREQLGAWRSFLRAHATITKVLESELVAEQDLSLAAYDVLVQLAEAPDRRRRMTELADAVLLSRSGVTRLVDRLERAGLVTRSPVANDGRGVAAELTRAGLGRLRTASRTHLRGIGTHFAARLHEDDLGALERISRRLAE
ncbi:MarR family winged helix-turn-helix transcriptional regulator [Pseudonocardia nigra]|uniref:MarR family winged helix-turn-helix transcriptional regulator n=1 Tax=Pseudonocardia nigra TaxID=1921578 RepID=UPI001C5E09AE|nr:MarR family transcriptional regulator [Pseudonocardia nigra]